MANTLENYRPDFSPSDARDISPILLPTISADPFEILANTEELKTAFIGCHQVMEKVYGEVFPPYPNIHPQDVIEAQLLKFRKYTDEVLQGIQSCDPKEQSKHRSSALLVLRNASHLYGNYLCKKRSLY